MADAPAAPAGLLRVALAGHRNVGKSTLFNALTGTHQKIANYPGVTVERREGSLRLPQGRGATLLDLPGANSLVSRSPDEEIVERALLGDLTGIPAPDVVVLVVDATQLRRGLFLLSQLLDCGARVVVCLNMADDARREGIWLDAAALSRLLQGLPVVETVAPEGTGLEQLKQAVDQVAREKIESSPPRFPHIAALPGPSPERWKLLRQAARDPALARLETEERWAFVQALLARLGARKLVAQRRRSDRIDRLLLHPLLGPVIFTLVMGLLFQAVFVLATPAMDGISSLTASLGSEVHALLPGGLANDFLVNGVISGVGAVVVFLPQILILFLFLGILEDSGYMTRAAFIADAPLRRMGLSGRSFIPLLSSFACAVPGIMAARTIEDRRERFLTIMVAPLMTCSARLPIYAILIGTFIPNARLLGFLGLQGLVLLGLYLGGLFMAVLAALFLSRLLKSRESTPILELPPYRFPRPRAILGGLKRRTWSFLRRAGTIILLMAIVIWALSSFPRLRDSTGLDGPSFAARQVAQSYAGRLGHAIEPVIKPLGFDWRIGIGLVGSLAAREVFVSTMAVVYATSQDDKAGLVSALRTARDDRSGAPVYSLATVLALLAFYMVALQCTSTMVMVQRETGSWKVVLLQFLGLGVAAWVLAFLTHSVAAALL